MYMYISPNPFQSGLAMLHMYMHNGNLHNLQIVQIPRSGGTCVVLYSMYNVSLHLSYTYTRSMIVIGSCTHRILNKLTASSLSGDETICFLRTSYRSVHFPNSLVTFACTVVFNGTNITHSSFMRTCSFFFTLGLGRGGKKKLGMGTIYSYINYRDWLNWNVQFCDMGVCHSNVISLTVFCSLLAFCSHSE